MAPSAHIAVGDDGDGQRVLDRAHRREVGRPRAAASLAAALPGVHGKQAAAGRLQSTREADRLGERGQQPDLAEDRHRERLAQRAHDAEDACPVLAVAQVGAVHALARALLRAPEVDVDGVAPLLHQQRGRDQRRRVVASELDHQRPVGSVFCQLRVEDRVSVGCIGHEPVGEEHLRVAQVSAVPAAEQPKRQVAAAHHGGGDTAVWDCHCRHCRWRIPWWRLERRRGSGLEPAAAGRATVGHAGAASRLPSLSSQSTHRGRQATAL